MCISWHVCVLELGCGPIWKGGRRGVVGCEMEAKVGLWWDGGEERRGEQGVLVGLVLLEVVGRGRGRGERCGADRLREKDVVDGAVCRCA